MARFVSNSVGPAAPCIATKCGKKGGACIEGLEVCQGSGAGIGFLKFSSQEKSKPL